MPALVGAKEVIVGGGMYVNPDSVSEPNELVTITLPLDPLPTIAVIVVELTMINEAAATPPNETELVPVKLAPLM